MNRNKIDSLSIRLRIIGIVHSPYKEKSEAPPQGKNKIAEIEIEPKYKKGLKDLESFSHLHIFYWLHKSKGHNLKVVTPWESTPHGLFSTRSPHRPNPLGYASVKLLNIRNNIIKVRGIDAIEGTPVIDIKPYVKSIDNKKNVKSGWLEKINLDRD